MANVTAVANLKNAVAYLPDGVRQIADSIMRFLPPDVIASDGAGWFTFPAISTTKQELSATGKRPIAIIINAHAAAAASYVQFYNNPATSVTEGVNADFTIPCSNTNGECVALVIYGASWSRFWATGLTVAASSASETSAAPSVPPDVYVLFA